MAENTFDGWIIIDDTHYQDAKTGEIKEIVRDSLRLDRIDQNGTIQEMLDTIDSNFMEIARHGGGPAGIDGTDGEAGADGSNVEYIYCRADEMKIGVQYPDTVEGIKGLFINIENSAITDASGNKYVNYPSNSNPRVKWFDHAQGVTREFKNEYALIRVKRGDTWYYPSEPVLWAHWGETGRDGDGVEYIFLLSNKSTTEDPGILTSVKKIGEMTAAQEAIYNIDDFYPGKNWFNDVNMDAARKALKAAGAEMTESEFENRWRSYFGFCDGGYDWTDEPIGTDPLHIYEYVSIRKSTTDENDKKTWGNFSEPALWSNYSLPSRTFIIYNNLIDTQTPAKIDNGKGWWDTTTDKLIFDKSGYELPSGWTDENTEPEDNEITWMCNGIFKNTGENVYWSKPMRITGRDGKQGEDGTTIEFIYTLSKTTPNYPTIDRETTDSNPSAINTKEELFDAVENDTQHNPKYAEYGQSRWYDRAQPISPDEPTEWVFSRRREKESDLWEYDDTPIIWAHWGEDGTDGDGVEYIFYTTLTNQFNNANKPPKISEITGNNDLAMCKKLIYNIDDFYPGEQWFTDNETDIKKAITDAGYDVSNFDAVKTAFNKGWSDNPKEVNAYTPFQWVSIRRSRSDENTGGKRKWEDFSDPVLWNSYGKSTRTFMIYCNVDDGIVPPVLQTPVGGYWNVNPGTGEFVLAKDNTELGRKEKYWYPAIPGITEKPNDNINIWQDSDVDIDDKITWVSCGIFTDDGNLIGNWSSPFRITGHNGEKGADGSNIQFIYALCDTMPLHPLKGDKTDEEYKVVLNDFFDDVNDESNDGYWPAPVNNVPVPGSQLWTDNPTGIENKANKRTEWVWQRTLPIGKEDSPQNWIYTDSPVQWAHWGEDGTDGDGVEYIFYAGTSISGHDPNVSISDDYQEYRNLIYQISDFYPGLGWFRKDTGSSTKHKDDVSTLLSSKIDGFSSSYFNEQWNSDNPFGLAKGWTDNPSGVSFDYPFEWVSIRRTTNDPEDPTGKVWGEFSEPKPWANYNIDTRTFIVYCNLTEGITPKEPASNYGKWAKSGNVIGLIGGTWNNNNEFVTGPNSGKFAAPVYKSNGDLVSDRYWSDTDVDEPGKIAWLCSGTYAENGKNVSWSKPFRLTGEQGAKGADGSNIEFVYCLSETLPSCPSYINDIINDELANDYNDTDRNNFFKRVNNAKYQDIEEGNPNYLDPEEFDWDKTNMGKEGNVYYYEFGGSRWTDNPQGISDIEGKRKEWVWSRSREASDSGETKPWTFPESPVVWAHWGEDGTDGDGVEYIFVLKQNKVYTGSTSDISTWNNYWDYFLGDSATETAKAIYNMDDFVPNPEWFDKKDGDIYVNRKAVEDKMNSEVPGSFELTDWNNARTTVVGWNLGDWEDNPQDLKPEYAYEYVSIRKTTTDPEDPNKKWGAFSYPKLWTKYNVRTFKAFAFTSTAAYADISAVQPTGLQQFNVNNFGPINDSNNGITWTDGPTSSTDKPQVWMTSATITENNDGTDYVLVGTWSKPTRMADSAEFQVEWATNDIYGTDLSSAINSLSNGKYNFKKFLEATKANGKYNENAAEAAWRYVVKNGYNRNTTYPSTSPLYNVSFSEDIPALDLDFNDTANGATLMATCQLTSGEWSNWQLARVKGEEGKPGKSLNVKKGITYESKLAQNETYTLSSVRTKFHDSIKSTLTVPTPAEGYLAIVYPYAPIEKDDSSIFWGDDDKGGALYMAKYTNGQWVDYYDENTVTQQDEEIGDTHPSPNGHLILWDGDTWQDVGSIVGPAGPVSEICVKYAIDSTTQGKTYDFWNDTMSGVLPKYVGFITYPESQIPNEIISNADHPSWNWQIFKGQDGFGYEYIFKTNNANSAPNGPTNPTSWHTQANIIPNNYSTGSSNANNAGWLDDPMAPTSNSRYVWMCWRKYNHATQLWTDFSSPRLWQVYAKSVDSVTEYFHADSSIRPVSDPDYFTMKEPNSGNTNYNYWHRFWKSYDSINPSGNNGKTATKPDEMYGGTYNIWGEVNKYIFNREVITYSDGTKDTIDAHFIAVWEDGIKDMEDYYCLDSVDDGTPPAMDTSKNPIVPITDAPSEDPQPGKNYWVLGTSIPKMDKDWPVLWNVTKKTYLNPAGDEDLVTWTTPLVLGVFGEGENGQDSIYVDLDNEMDTVQIDSTGHALRAGTYTAILNMYKGSELMTIQKVTVSGEDDSTNPLSDNLALSYKLGNTSTYTRFNENTNINADEIKIEIKIRDNEVINEYNKLIFSITHSETGKPNIIRKASYTLIGTTNPSIFSIVPSDNVLVERIVDGSTIISPNQITLKVVEQIGNTKIEHTQDVSGDGGFQLIMTKNTDAPITLGNNYTVPTMSGSTCLFQAGDKLTFTVYVDTPNTPDGDDNTEPDIVMDTETIYVLKEGSNGAKGDTGNGYQYAYALFDNSKSYASAETIALSISNVKASLPTVTVVGYGNIPLAVSTIPHGADKDHQYEYRSERSGFGTSWSDWSDPVTIARYLDGGDIESTVSRMVSEQTATLASQITDGLNSANARITNISNLLDGKFDASGNYTGTFSDGVTSGLVTAVTNQMDIPGQVTSTLNGFITTSSSATAFSDWLNKTTGDVATVQQSLTAQENGMASLTNQVTELEAETGKTSTALTTLQADAQDHFASLDNSVANAAYLKNTDGYLLIDKPDYSIWFENMSDVNDPNKNRNVEWMLFSGYEKIDDGDGGYIVSSPMSTFVPLQKTLIEEDYFNYNKTKRVIFLDFYVVNYDNYGRTETIEAYTTNTFLNAIKQNVNIRYYINTNEFDFYSHSLSESYAPIELMFNPETDRISYDYENEDYPEPEVVLEPDVESSYVKFSLYTIIDIPEEPENDYIDFNRNTLTWKIGISEVNNLRLSEDDNDDQSSLFGVAYTKTASIFEEPLIKDYNGSALVKDFTNDILLNTKRNKDFGYTLLRNTSGRIEEAETNGVLSTSVIGNNENNISMHFVPVDTPLEQFIPTLINNPNTFNSTYPTTISDFSVKDYSSRQSNPNNGDTRSYYVVCAYGNSLPDNSFEYKITLPDSDKIGNNTVSFNQEPLLKDLYVLNPSIADGNSYNQDGTDYAQFSTDSNGFRSCNFSDFYDGSLNVYTDDHTGDNLLFDTYKMFITSLYDEVNLTYNCTFSPESPDEIAVSIKMELLWGDSTYSFVNKKTIFELSSTISDSVTYSGNLSCFEDIDLSDFKNGPLWFQVRLACDRLSIDDIAISYKIETVNKLTGEIDLHDVNTWGTFVAGDLNDNGIDDVVENISGLSNQETAEYIIGTTENDGIYPSSSTIAMDNTKKEIHTYFEHDKNMISMFCISSTNKGTVLNLNFNVSNEINYMIIPSYYSAETLKEINSTVRYYLKKDKLFFKDNDTGFVNSEKYNTTNWTTISSNTSVKIDFNNAYYDLNTNKYYYTIAQYSEKDCSLENFNTYVNYTLESTNWWEQTSTYSKISTSWHPYYMLDKITVSVNDKSLRKELDDNRSLARNNNNVVGVTNYKDVRDIDKPYLITSVSELASISQTVNEGIACTSIVTSAGGSNAAAVFQASEDGSDISFLADRVGIKSTHFNLDKSGVTMQGNLYATDNFDNITAGVIGSDTVNTDVKFFAGTKIPKNGENYPDLQSMIEEAPFRVYEDGTIVLETKDKKTYIDTDGVLHASGAIISGDVSARSFNAEDTRNVEIDIDDDIYSGSINKTTTITGNSFSILASGTLSYDSGNDSYEIGNGHGPNGLFIEIVDKLKNPDPSNSEITDDYLYCVPVLCMVYNGQKYVLSPASWITNQISGQTDTDMYWELVRPVYKYTFISPSALPNSYTGELPTKSIAKDYYVTNRSYDGRNNSTITGYTYYIFRDDLGKDKFIMNYPSFKWIVGEESDNLYKFKIAKIDVSSYNPNEQDTERQKYLNMLFSHGLIEQASMNGTGALTLESKILNKKYIGYTEGSPTYITDSTCDTFNSYLQNNIYISVPYDDTYYVKEYSSDFTSRYNSNYYGVKSIASAIRKMYYSTIDDIEWRTMYNNHEIDVLVSGYDDFAPFNSSSYGQNGFTEYSITLNWYPNTGITNYGLNTTGTTQSILVKANIDIYSSFLGYSGNNVISIRGCGDNSDYSCYDVGVTSIEYSINFDFVLNLNSSLSFDIYGSNSNVVSRIESFLEQIDFEQLLQNPLESNIVGNYLDYHARISGSRCNDITFTL